MAKWMIENNTEKWMLTVHSILDILRHLKAANGSEKMVEKAHGMIDSTLDSSGIWKQASCSKGCSFCCHENIHLSMDEAQYLNKKIKQFNLPVNQEVLKKQKEAKDFTKLKWADQKCSLLKEDGTCGVYEFRPSVCRTHNSMENPKFCHKGKYPKRAIQEGRIIIVEAVAMALIMVDENFNTQKDNGIVLLHEILECRTS